MTEAKYLKIISDLFRLTGYAKGILNGLYWDSGSNRMENMCIAAEKYLEEQQNLILMQLDEKND